ncbi:hypothetical protein AL548_015165 [Vibrio vulnificus]|uniref:Uncharacterized protein n=1 Tax=Vibrio vulnificus TaxID=672 RepID=A0ABX4WVH3_VIBVL|nr:hypothetical protein AL548_015165 [Vibrio vulnificus]
MALKIQRIASINFCASARLGRWLNQQFDLRFLSFSGQISKSDFQNYDSFRFSTFWLLCVNQSRVNLGSIKT